MCLEQYFQCSTVSNSVPVLLEAAIVPRLLQATLLKNCSFQTLFQTPCIWHHCSNRCVFGTLLTGFVFKTQTLLQCSHCSTVSNTVPVLEQCLRFKHCCKFTVPCCGIVLFGRSNLRCFKSLYTC